MQTSLHSSLQYLLLAAFWFREVSPRSWARKFACEVPNLKLYTMRQAVFYVRQDISCRGHQYRRNMTWRVFHCLLAHKLLACQGFKFISSLLGVRCSNQRASKPVEIVGASEGFSTKYCFSSSPSQAQFSYQFSWSVLLTADPHYQMYKIMNGAHLQSLLTSQGKKKIYYFQFKRGGKNTKALCWIKKSPKI